MTTAPYRMHPLTLRFPGATERAFEADHFRDLAQHQRRMGLFAIPATAGMYQVLRAVLPDYGQQITQMQAIFTAGIAVPVFFGHTSWLGPRLRLYQAGITVVFAGVIG